jgi:peptidoglycan/LPS O-acetylase OafA/YrhL
MADIDSRGASRSDERAPLPGLTGLRFIAAAFVLLAHLINVSLPPQITHLPEMDRLINLVAVGMSLFFVLSGFVIHYNYATLVRHGGWRGLVNFFAARFARLYPLYFAVLIVSLLSVGTFELALRGDPVAIGNLTEVFPYYLSLTFSWIYKPYLGSSLIYQYPEAPSLPVAWSISTEWFFYLVYPLLCVPLVLIKRPGRAIAVMIGFSIAVLVMMHTVFLQLSAIDTAAVEAFGTVASSRANLQDSFLRWLIYFCPLAALPEFVLGCLTAALFLSLRDRPPRGIERHGVWLQLAILGALAAQEWVTFAPDQPFPFLLFLHTNFGFAPLLALLIFTVVRYDTVVSRTLSRPRILLAGEASYSLYLLHPAILDHLGGPIMEHRGAWSFALFMITGGLVFIAAIGLAIISYMVFEAPARRWLRRLLSVAPVAGRARRRLMPLGWVAVGLVFIFIPLGTGLMADSASSRTGAIRVTFATYGQNCGAHTNNALEQVRQMCAGRDRCSYTVDVKLLGDPANGCSKDFSIEWICGTSGRPYSKYLAAEAGLGSIVELMCPIAKTAETSPAR